MDEDYLDSLLGEAAGDIKINNDFDRSVDADSGIDLDVDDLGDISLEELDDFEGLDLGDLELDDIDFDDVDVTSFDVGQAKQEEDIDENDFSLDTLIEEEQEEASASDPQEEAILESISDGDDVFSDADSDLFKDLGVNASSEAGADTPANNIPDFDDMFSNAQVADESTMQDLFGGGNDNSALDEMLDSAEAFDELLSASTKASGQNAGENIDGVNMDGMVQEGFNTENLDMGDMNVENMNIDDLFSALGIDGDAGDSGDDYTKSEAGLDDMINSASIDMNDSAFSDIADLDEESKKPAKKTKKKREKNGEKTKKTFSEILFGEPDEDDIEEEKRLLAKKEQKKIAKEEKNTKKEEKKAEKEAALTLKKETAKKTKQDKLDKKKAKAEAEAAEEAEEAKDQKPVSNPVVVIVFVVFALVGGLAYFGSQYFNYSEVIRKAADYYERHRFRLAYDEVSGVEVKKKDELLRDRIYTVMYVERLYESYENNIKLGRHDKALDALLRGIEKYDEHYEEAIELDIKADIDLCRVKILDALAATYGLTEADAYEIMKLEGKDYLEALSECCKAFDTETDTETGE